MSENIRKKAILLLMNDVDAAFFAKLIKGVSPEVSVLHMNNIPELDEFTQKADADMRLISFCTGDIVPARVIERLNGNCFNFHPGPPDRPGYMPAPFALKENAEAYGVTFHYMKPKVDTGAIIDVARFDVPKEKTQEALELAAYKALLKMVIGSIKHLADLDFAFPPSGDQWSGYKTTRKDLEALQEEQSSSLNC